MNLNIKHLTIQIDEEDIIKVEKHSWRVLLNSNYIYFKERGDKFVYLHQVLMGRPCSPLMVDHINGDVLDNRKQNLRIVTRAQNALNNERRRNGKLKFPYRKLMRVRLLQEKL